MANSAGTSIPTNGEVNKMVREAGLADATMWLIGLWDVDEGLPKTPQSLASAIKKVKAECASLQKNTRQEGKKALEEYCQRPFRFPVPLKAPRRLSAPKDGMDPAVMMDVCEELHRKTEALTAERDKLSEETSELQEKLESVQAKLEKNSRDLRNATDRERYHMRKARILEATLESGESGDEEELLVEEESALQEDIDCLIQELETYKSTHKENLQLREEMKELQDSAVKEVHTYDADSGSFTPEFRELVYKLLGLHVSSTQVSATVSAVLEFAGLNCERLPRRSTVSNWNVERLALAQMQIAEELPAQADTTLYSDETSKFGHRYMGYHISDGDGRFWVLGLRDIPTKSSEDSLATFKEILSDLDDCLTSGEAGKDILLKIRSTMSDRAATESKFVELLETYRGEVLPTILENYDEMSEDAKTAMTKLHMFFCGLHSLIQYAEVSVTAVGECEKADDLPPMSGDVIVKAGEPGTLRLIRAAAKAFARGGDDQSGKYYEFNDFCQDVFKRNKIKSMPLKTFRGNRFNSVFFEAEYVYFLSEKMVEFLQKCPSKNKLLRAVLADLSVPSFIAGLKALALVSKLITSPLWRLLEDCQIHILEMNQHYTELYNFLVAAPDRVGDVMLGEFSPFPHLVKDDCYLKALLEPTPEYDELVSSRLCIIFPALAKVISKQCQDHLPGGQHTHNDTPEARKQFDSVAKHNKFSESVFAYLDNLLRYKPHVGTLGTESYVMFTMNKTADWLASKTVDQKTDLIKSAMKSAPALRRQYAKRCQVVNEKRRAQQREKWESEERRRAAVLKAKEALTDDIIHYGLWQSEDGVDSALEDMHTKKEKTAALKV